MINMANQNIKDNVNYNAFLDDPNVEPPRKSGLRIDSEKSKFKPTVNRESFDERLQKHIKNEEDLKSLSVEVASAFFAAIKDRTLPENKTIQNKESEREILNNLAKIANALNNDETQPEGIGSVALIKLLLETVLYQRDLINILGYNTSVLDSKIKAK